MVILGGLDVHRAQITYDYLDTVTLRGRKKRAKTDRADARHLRQ
ncbi:MAG TPA: IS110 family transposase, partial [Actinobacteria bacterium]|nr:IS110 family transposase [Actinomycetota bacterium]